MNEEWNFNRTDLVFDPVFAVEGDAFLLDQSDDGKKVF